MTETDNEIMQSYKNKQGYVHGSQSPQARGKLDVANIKSSGKRPNRSIEVDQELNDYIIGPDSNHSMIKHRDTRQVSQESDKYLRVRVEREVEESVHSHGSGNLAKKRKVRRAANSQHNRDLYSKYAHEKQ